MRIFLKPVFIAAVAMTLATGAAVAASDYLLTIDSPKGGDAATGGQGSIEIQSYSWGASNPTSVGSSGMSAGRAKAPDQAQTPVKAPRDISTGQSSGRQAAPQVGDTRTLMLAVRESPTLVSSPVMSACASGKHLGSVTLTGRGGAIELEDVMVTSCAAGAGMRKFELTGHVTLIK